MQDDVKIRSDLQLTEERTLLAHRVHLQGVNSKQLARGNLFASNNKEQANETILKITNNGSIYY